MMLNNLFGEECQVIKTPFRCVLHAGTRKYWTSKIVGQQNGFTNFGNHSGAYPPGSIQGWLQKWNEWPQSRFSRTK